MKKLLGLLIIVVVLIFCVKGYFYAKKTIFPNTYNSYIQEYSKEYGVDPLLVKGIVRTESDFNTNALSNMGAKGLMQITNSTGEWIAGKVGVKDFTPIMLYNPKINIEFGCWYIKNLENEFKNKDNAIAAYNAGRNNVKKWLVNKKYSTNGITLNKIPFKETANYVKRVNLYEKIYSYLY